MFRKKETTYTREEIEDIIKREIEYYKEEVYNNIISHLYPLYIQTNTQNYRTDLDYSEFLKRMNDKNKFIRIKVVEKNFLNYQKSPKTIDIQKDDINKFEIEYDIDSEHSHSVGIGTTMPSSDLKIL